MLMNFMDVCGVEDWFQKCLYVYSTNVVRLVSACSPLPLRVFARSGPSLCAKSLHHQCCSTRDRPLRSRPGSGSYARWVVFRFWTTSPLLLIKFPTIRRCISTHGCLISPPVFFWFFFPLYFSAPRSGSDASPVLRCDPLGSLPC